MHSACDGSGHPTLVVVQVNKENRRIFGGYATNSLRANGNIFGSTKCFLFSLTNDCKIPFHGREVRPLPMDPEEEEEEYTPENPVAMYGSKNVLSFGSTDLVLKVIAQSPIPLLIIVLFLFFF